MVFSINMDYVSIQNGSKFCIHGLGISCQAQKLHDNLETLSSGEKNIFCKVR